MLTGILIVWPLLAALLILLLNGGVAKKVALGAAIIELLISLFVVFQFEPNATTQFLLNWNWIPSLGINFIVGIDGISLILVLLTTILVPFIILSSFHHTYEKPALFYAFILMMQMALIGVFVALDGFLFYVFWELALIPIYFICLFWGGANSGRITLKFFIYTLAGSLFMLIGLTYVYLHTPGSHSFAIDALYQAGRALPADIQGTLFWFIFIAFAIKIPVFPFHTWQPDTYTTAPAPGTMLLSAIMLKMGIYGAIRWLLPIVPLGVQAWGQTAIILSVIGIIYAACIAIVQKDFKRLIAYSSISHVGLISAGIFTLNVQSLQGAMIQMLTHGINVFALFYIIDLISQRTNTRDIPSLGGIRNMAPQLAGVFMIVMFGSVALPFTNGFVGEFLLINGLFQYNAWMAALAGLTIVLGAVYMLKAYQGSMLGTTNTTTALFTDLKANEKAVLYPIALLVIVIGVYPKPLLALSEPAIQNLLLIVGNLSNGVK